MFIYIFFNKIKINTITFSIYLYIGKEKYETLAKKIFALQLEDLKDNRIIDDDGIHWPIKFYFSDD